MAGEKKISQLTAAVAINDADQVELAQSGSSLRTAWSLIKSTLKTYFDAVYAPIAKTKATDITSSSATLTLNTSYGINYHLLTESTVLQVPDTSGWANGTTARLDLFVQVDAGGSYAMTFHANWKFDGGTTPTLTATASAIDHLVVTVTKTSGLTLAWVGLAGADIKVTA